MALNHILVLGLILHADRQTDTQTDRTYILTPVDEVAEHVQVFIALQDVWSTRSFHGNQCTASTVPTVYGVVSLEFGSGGAEWWEGLSGGRG